MKDQNNNKKIIAEVEVRVGLKVYKLEINSQFRWLFVLAILFVKFLFHFLRDHG